MTILNELNDKQREAATQIEGPVLIIAGAGSGKTKTITTRIANMIVHGISPYNILAVTFTNKAAAEMKERIHKTLSKISSSTTNIPNINPFVGTFHSFCVRFLREELNPVRNNLHKTSADDQKHDISNGVKSNFVIYDSDDQSSLVKTAMKELEIDDKQFKPSSVLAAISSAKNAMLNADKYAQRVDGYWQETIAKVFKKYEEELEKSNGLDFDDLLLKTVLTLESRPEILEKYQERYKYITVDEYQDTNFVQYKIINLLAQKYRNLCVVGDDQQCLPPETKIKTTNGIKAIKKITKKDIVLVASGNGDVCEKQIAEIKKFKYHGILTKITTQGGRIIKLTPNHLIFTRLQLMQDIYYVYLMYRHDKGYRVGLAKGSRTQKNRSRDQIGLIVRSNQEKADKMWILRVCLDRAEANYWEFFYAFKYGIPTVVFDTGNRSMKINQTQVDNLYKNIGTKNAAEKLMSDLNIFFEYPHWIPQGTIRGNSKRIRVRLTLFDDRRKSIINPWGMSRISLNTKDVELKQQIELAGFKTRKGKLKDWRLEIAKLDYGEIEQIAKNLKLINPELEILRSACLTKNKRLFFQPASHARPSMNIAVQKNGKIIEDVIKKIEFEKYDGYVYDLNVPQVHNYIANDFIVHNSIYAFRGADFRNILNFEKDYPEAKIVLLEENYRSTKNILNAANKVISKNTVKRDKNLWTQNIDGNLINAVLASNERQEADFATSEIRDLAKKEKIKLSQCCIMYRTNAQSRAVEESLIKNNLPYQLIGALRFYERKEIKDILAYLKIVFNPKDRISIQRILNVPTRGMGKYEKIYGSIVSQLLHNEEATEKDLEKIKSKKFEQLKKFADLIKEIKSESENESASLGHLLKKIIDKTNYEKYLVEECPDAENRMENIKELFSVAASYDHLPLEEGIKDFLENTALVSDTDNIDENSDKVQVMTIHASKGLEFEVVFIIGLEEGIFPHSRSALNPAELEEERRLCYVAITRAKKHLYMMFAMRRRLFGAVLANSPSRFLFDIPQELISFRQLDSGSDGLLEIEY